MYTTYSCHFLFFWPESPPASEEDLREIGPRSCPTVCLFLRIVTLLPPPVGHFAFRNPIAIVIWDLPTLPPLNLLRCRASHPGPKASFSPPFPIPTRSLRSFLQIPSWPIPPVDRYASLSFPPPSCPPLPVWYAPPSDSRSGRAARLNPR